MKLAARCREHIILIAFRLFLICNGKFDIGTHQIIISLISNILPKLSYLEITIITQSFTWENTIKIHLSIKFHLRSIDCRDIEHARFIELVTKVPHEMHEINCILLYSRIFNRLKPKFNQPEPPLSVKLLLYQCECISETILCFRMEEIQYGLFSIECSLVTSKFEIPDSTPSANAR